jgi:hypothetical protein
MLAAISFAWPTTISSNRRRSVACRSASWLRSCVM